MNVYYLVCTTTMSVTQNAVCNCEIKYLTYLLTLSINKMISRPTYFIKVMMMTMMSSLPKDWLYAT